MNNNIFPCLWYDQDAVASARFYCEVFGGKLTADTPVVLNIELFGQKFMLLNAGPQFTKNPSVSFTVFCQTEEEILGYWQRLSEKGKVMMPLDSYPWSRKFGWVEDQYGVSWQLTLDEKIPEQKIMPALMFIHQNNGKAQQAMELYTQIFPDSEIKKIQRYGDSGENNNAEPAGHISQGHFIINGYSFLCTENSYDHQFDFNEAISIVVMTDDQSQTDHYWNALVAGGGRESMCGWLKDRYGLSWQIVPKRLIELMNDQDPAKAHKVVQAMFQMQKIIIEDLEKAYYS
ncbi:MULTISPECIES: VOC family protein [Chryseobacterium]|uniref:3-demethylubiquinone-9 3-methyltransferase (Glyoxalase superfamily) n=1 Tax=Chryseobacterium camelliae TaxID=1265445 RepID=A0ABU0TEU3_9FLAO|nr:MULTISPECIES: VOC family protein [Chryseobacterium]MDT3406617.1 putative 3-demethylubiquinone-9 3-methyltransferase (glyoxalase superfamily) [Pseudacidovorax intermedius]MDQ1095587.1 putative 3-demethylubiquinone-9 3-methyltransferase (glyoxalase superfamily) [Chryseobacterium camelliae]MDQ1099523.1 putative 3-demethylubiquinone-9 3-methyltransferase (glyoxalase superfamily) [Chryseobacterium sp. SORGH_AS_1048]MDR6086870.1 putative 3-demethylubiquinone-9 3-methyltransferase (glyoxalase super